MELDIYIPSLHLAFEYQVSKVSLMLGDNQYKGQQHFEDKQLLGSSHSKKLLDQVILLLFLCNGTLGKARGL